MVEPIEPPPPQLPPDNLPDAIGPTALPAGADEDLTTLADADYTDALDTLQRIDDVNIVSIPDATIAPHPASCSSQMIAHCELMQDRFAVLDSLPGLPPVRGGTTKPGVRPPAAGLDSTRGYAALYYPWLRVPAAGRGAPILVPPSGHVCGIMRPRRPQPRGAQGAGQRGVNGAVDIEPSGNTSNGMQGQLNLAGINVHPGLLRRRPAPCCGAPAPRRAPTSAGSHVNMRRLFLFLEESIQ